MSSLVGWVLVRAELLIAAVTLLGAVKSAYNGWLSRHILRPLDQIEEVADRTERVEENQEEMAGQQELLTDAVIALGRSHREGSAEFDVELFREEADRADRSENLLDPGDDP